MVNDRATGALRSLIAALERSSERTAASIVRARDMERLRETGYEWRQILATESRPLLSDTLFQEMAVMNEIVGRLRREEARALREEGASDRDIADLFGVTVEHVEAMLDGRE
jgi:hypothetical protein